MKAKAIKQQEVDWLKSAFTENSVIVACNFQGIPVADDVELRRKIRDSGSCRIGLRNWLLPGRTPKRLYLD